jgi:hypothetical protein
MPEKTKFLEKISRKTPGASSPSQTAAPSVSPSGFDLAAIQRAAGNMAMQHATGGQKVRVHPESALNFLSVDAPGPAATIQQEPHGQIQRFPDPLSMFLLGNVLSPTGGFRSYGTAAAAPAAAAVTSKQRSPEQLRGMMETYLTYNTRNVWATVGEHMLSVQFPTPHARLTWVDHQAFVEKMLKQLESWIEFTKITQLDEILYPTNAAKTIGDLLPATRAWSVDVGIAIAHALHIAVVASLKRLAERYLAVADSQGLSGEDRVLVDELVTSWPIDRFIAPALCAPHAVTVEPLDPKAAKAAKGKPVGIKDVTLSPEGARDRRLWNWVRADSPSDATAEDVAAKIWRVTDQHGDTISSFSSYLLAAAPPLFGIPKRFAITSSIFKQYAPADALAGEDSVETQLLKVANSTATDEVVLHGQPLSPPLPAGAKAVEPELPTILATFNDCAMQLAFLQKELKPWGLAAQVNPAIAFVARKQAELVADPKRLGEWSVVANGQKDRLGRIAGGIHTLAVSALKLGVTDPSSPQAGSVRDILELFAVAAGTSHLGQASEAKFLQGLDLQSGLSVRALQSTEVSMMGGLQKIQNEAATMGELRKDEKSRHIAELSHRAIAVQDLSRRLQARMLSGLDVNADEFEEVSMQSEEVALESRLFGTLAALTDLNRTSISLSKGDAAIIASMFSGEFRGLPRLTKHLFDEISLIRSNWYSPLKGFYEEEKIYEEEKLDESHERRKKNRQTRRTLLTEAQKRFAKIAEEKSLNEFFAHAAELIENQQFRTACVKVAAMIGISIIGGGIAGLAGRAVGAMLMEATGASTIADLSLVARAGKFATQISVDTTISATGTAAIQGTSFTEAWKENLIVGLGTSAAFGTIGRYVEGQAKLEGKIAATWASSGKLGKLFIVGKEVGALGVHTLWGVAIGSVAHRIVSGETQASPAGLRDWGLQFVSVTVGRHISERVTTRLKVYQALEQHFEDKGRGLVAAAKDLQALAKEVIFRKSPAKAVDLLEQHEALLRKEIEAVDEAITRTHGMPDELYSARESLKLEQEAAGAEANLDTKFALLGLEELVPGALWKGSEHDINQAVAKAKQHDNTATASRDETTGVWTIKVGERTIEVHQTDWTSSSKPGDTQPSEPGAPTVKREPAAPAGGPKAARKLDDFQRKYIEDLGEELREAGADWPDIGFADESAARRFVERSADPEEAMVELGNRIDLVGESPRVRTIVPQEGLPAPERGIDPDTPPVNVSEVPSALQIESALKRAGQHTSDIRKGLPPERLISPAPTSLEGRLERLAELGGGKEGAGVRRIKRIHKHQRALGKGRLSAAKRAKIETDVATWEQDRDLAPKLRQLQLRPYLNALQAAYAQGQIPFPVDNLTRIAQHTGGDFERAWRQAQGEANPQFSFVSHTADREIVQIDSYDAARRVPQELKSGHELQSTLEDIPESELRYVERIPKFREHQKQMQKQAIFARDRGMPTYEWVVTTEKADIGASAIKATLPKSLQKFIEIRYIRL